MSRRERLTSAQVAALCEPGAGDQLGLRDRDVAAAMASAGIVQQVTVSQAQLWGSGAGEAPAWLFAVQKAGQQRPTSGRRRVETGEDRKRLDRALCPVEAAQILGLKLHAVAGAMRAAGVTDQVTIEKARQWRLAGDDVPPWLASMQADRDRRAAERAEREAVRERVYRAGLDALYPVVLEKIQQNRRVKGPDQELVAADIVFRVWKDMHGWSGDPDEMVEEQAILDWAGWEPPDVPRPLRLVTGSVVHSEPEAPAKRWLRSV